MITIMATVHTLNTLCSLYDYHHGYCAHTEHAGFPVRLPSWLLCTHTTWLLFSHTTHCVPCTITIMATVLTQDTLCSLYDYQHGYCSHTDHTVFPVRLPSWLLFSHKTHCVPCTITIMASLLTQNTLCSLYDYHHGYCAHTEHVVSPVRLPTWLLCSHTTHCVPCTITIIATVLTQNTLCPLYDFQHGYCAHTQHTVFPVRLPSWLLFSHRTRCVPCITILATVLTHNTLCSLYDYHHSYCSHTEHVVSPVRLPTWLLCSHTTHYVPCTMTIMATVLSYKTLCPLYDYHHGYCAHTQHVVFPVRLPSWLLCSHTTWLLFSHTTHCVPCTITIMATVLTQDTLCSLYDYQHGYCSHTDHTVFPVRLPSWLLFSHRTHCVPCTITIMASVLTQNTLCSLYDYHHGYCAHTEHVVSPVRLPTWLLCSHTTHCVPCTITIIATVLTQNTLCPLYDFQHGYCAHTQHTVFPVRLPSWLLFSHRTRCVPCITIMATVLTHNTLCSLYDYHHSYCSHTEHVVSPVRLPTWLLCSLTTHYVPCTITIMATVLPQNTLCSLYYHHGYCAHTQHTVFPVRLPSWLLFSHRTRCVPCTVTIIGTVLTHNTLCSLYDYYHGYCAHTQHTVFPVRLPSSLLFSHITHCVPCTITIMATVLTHNTLCSLYDYHHGYCAHTQHTVFPVRLPSWLLCSHTTHCVPCTITIMATVLTHNTLYSLYDYLHGYCSHTEHVVFPV